jgi:hypothetical protein
LGVAFFFGAAFFLVAAGLGAVPFETRPDLVLVNTVGLSTTAGAADSFLGFFALAFGLTAAVVFLVAVVVALGFAVAFFFAAGFFAVADLVVDLVVVVDFLVVDEAGLALGAASFLTSLTVPEGPKSYQYGCL